MCVCVCVCVCVYMCKYAMGHKEVPIPCLLKSIFLAVQLKRNVWNVAFHGKLNVCSSVN